MVFLDRKRLAEILGEEPPTGVSGVDGVTHDSREVRPGSAFVAVPGMRHDGTSFVPDALARGAALVVAEKPPSGGNGSPLVVVPDARGALAELSRAVFGDPSDEMMVHGVTGTNGKTTTSYALHAILAEAFGTSRCGLMTTAEVISGGDRRPSVRTTPESVEVQGTLREMLDRGVRHAVVEVSSHGVALKRVAGTRFRGALFTNLTRDHLDLHGSMEEYYRAKRELFVWAEGPKLANADDAHGRRLAGEVEGVSTFGVAEGVDYRVEGVAYGESGGTSFVIRHPGGVLELESPLLGGYNVENVAGAASLALALGMGEGAIRGAVRGMPQVPGRFERVVPSRELGFEVIVDYAHTDAGLEVVLEVAREVAGRSSGRPPRRVICVYGAAGDRDAAKRPLMGRVAARLADVGFITTDDAYTEDPAKIAREVAAGVPEGAGHEVVLDRREAIERALGEAGPGDVVVVAGKGHERVQHLPEGDVPFHDASVVRELLSKREIGKGG